MVLIVLGLLVIDRRRVAPVDMKAAMSECDVLGDVGGEVCAMVNRGALVSSFWVSCRELPL